MRGDLLIRDLRQQLQPVQKKLPFLRQLLKPFQGQTSIAALKIALHVIMMLRKLQKSIQCAFVGTLFFGNFRISGTNTEKKALFL